MITFEEFLSLADNRITSGARYCWRCYGPDAWTMDYSGEGFAMSMVYDTLTKKVFEASVYDYVNSRAYRLLNPAHYPALTLESREREVDFTEAWENVRYTDLETVSDFVEKAEAIRDGKVYDTRVDVPLDLDNDLLFSLMYQAHEQDLTLNQYVEKILRNTLDELQTGST